MMKRFRVLLPVVALAAGLYAAVTPEVAMAQGASPQAAKAAKPIRATGAAAAALRKDAVCIECHDESESVPILSMYQTPHGVRGDARAPTCQACHGESDAHVKGNAAGSGQKERPVPDVVFAKTRSGKASAADAQSSQCLSCHESGKRTHWSGSAHEARDVPCASCHAVHKRSDPVMSKRDQAETCYACHKTERAQSHRVSTHPIAAGKVACSDCHNPHGSTGPKLLAKASVNDLCYTCHAEKRGPFLWEHASANDDCTNCHTPHGSTTTPLLKVRPPFLCESCHFDTRHPSNMYSASSLPGRSVANINPTNRNNPPVQLAYRGCLNCHSQVHGSNHPAGQYFLR